MGQGISAHGTLVARAPAATPTVFTDIGELGDITPPSMGRNSTETITHNDDIDQYILGVLRRGELTFPINFVASGAVGATHNHVTGIMKSLIDHTVDGWRITFPNGVIWIMSGGVSNFAMHAPVDGALTADVSIRPSGLMKIGTVIVGTL